MFFFPHTGVEAEKWPVILTAKGTDRLMGCKGKGSISLTRGWSKAQWK